MGFDWFTTTARSMPIFANWDTLSSGDYIWLPSQGHNLVVDTLVRSGLVGLCVLALVLLAAVRSAHALDVSNHQIACFGFLIAFLVASSTEAIWVVLPNMELFPVVGLVFAVLIVARREIQSGDD